MFSADEPIPDYQKAVRGKLEVAESMQLSKFNLNQSLHQDHSHFQ